MTEQATILCVDDEKNVLKALRRLFHEEDYEILLAESGREGLAILEEHNNVDLIVSDYRMPEMNGVDFLREVYTRWPDTVRIVLSGYADTAAVVEAVNLGHIYKFIPKPWNDEEVLSTIRSGLETKALRKQNDRLSQELQTKNQELEKLNKELLSVNENLESLVEKRTEELEIRHHILQVSQAILDVLPMVVVGIDTEDMIVNCNREADDLFNNATFGLLGFRRQTVLPKSINELIDTMLQQLDQTQKIMFRQQAYQCQICQLSPTTAQGYILVMIPLA